MPFQIAFAAIFVLSAPIAFLGGQGYAPLLALTGLVALPYLRPTGRPAAWVIAMVLFLVWLAASVLWSPTGLGDGFAGQLSEGNFSLNAPVLRLVGSALFGAVVICVVLRSRSVGVWPLRVLAFTIGLHIAALLAIVLFKPQLLAVFYPDGDLGIDATQNIVRNSMALTLSLPLAFALVPAGFRSIGIVALTLLALVTSFALGAEAGAVSVLFAAAGWAFGSHMGAVGAGWVMQWLSAVLLLAPLWGWAFVQLLAPRFASLPPTMQTRLFSWEATLGKFFEKPVLGHGLGASRTWSETLGDDVERMAQLGPIWQNFRAVPGHPHNMPLHIWSETGAIGALLGSVTLFLLGRQVARLEHRWGAPVAALAAAAAAPALLSYSAWSELYWSQLALIVAAIIIAVRATRPRPTL